MDQCLVEPPLASRLSGTENSDKIEVPKSVPNTHHWIHLRPDDTLNFEQYGIKIRVDVEVGGRSQLTSQTHAGASTSAYEDAGGLPQDVVQVRSSNVDGDGDDATDSGGEDLDAAPAFDDAGAESITPKKSLVPAEPAIKETPNAGSNRAPSLADTDGDADERAFYSTARNDELDGAPVSPSVQAKARLESTSAAAETTIDRTSDRSSADLLDDEVVLRAKTQITYGGKDRIAVPSESLPGEMVSPTDDDGAESKRSVADSESATEDNIRQMLTSEPMNGPEVAGETARRSLKRRSDSTKEDSEQSASSKKRKVKVELDDPADQTPTGSAQSTRSSGRLKKPTRQSPEQDTEAEVEADSEADADEITVASRKKRKTSPQVVIKQRNSETPSNTAVSPMIGKTPKVLLSRDSGLRKSASKWLKDQGSEILDDVKSRRSHFICVVDGSLKTAKVLRSLALGKQVVTENWITDSKKAGQFLDPDDYVHPDVREHASTGRHRLFHGRTLFFTNTLADKVYMNGWQDIQSLMKEAGASSVHKGSSADFAQHLGRQPVLCFGADNNDADVGRLQTQHSCIVYHKALISHALISGELDLDDEEFHLPAGGSRKKR